MKTLFATLLTPCPDLSKYADAINNGRTDSVYFYVNGDGDKVSVSYTFGQLSEKAQAEELKWFLSDRNYTIN